jgi:gliding motility-associated-like protein
LSITANNATKVYGATNPTLGVTYSGFVGSDNAASLTTQPGISTTAITTSAVGTYPITASGAVSNNYTFNYTVGTLTVTQATLTVAASNATKVYGAANPTLAVTYTGFVGTDNAASLTNQPTVTTTATTTSPVGTYPITASGAASSNYTFSYTAGTLTVTQATLTIAANNATKTYGAANPTLGVTYTGFVGTDNAASLITQPTIATTAVTGSTVGTYPITASGAAGGNYTFSYNAGTLTVTPATLTIAASNATKVYGAANPTLGVTYSGFVGTDNAASLTTQPSVATTATTTSSVGTYPITASGAASSNYAFSYTAGILTVTQATLTVAASNATKVYGAANPTLAVTYSGFIGSDNAASLTTQPSITTTATTTSSVGTYPITASGAASSNYTFNYTAGTLTVTPATLTIAASNANKTYGAANPTLGVIYTGFVGADNAASLTTQPTIATTAVTGSAVGTYPITPSGAVSANYTIAYTAGTLTVNKATLTIAANNANKVYGAVNPALGVTYTGFVNGDTNASLTTQPGIATTAVTSSPAGTYPVTASGAVAANYTISYTAGTLTVTPATLTISASSGTKVYGTANPAFTASYTGFVNGDTNASLTTQATIATTAIAGSSVGTYPVTASGAVSANYTISYTAGTLTVTPAALNIAASNATKVYGSVNPVLGATYTGFVNGDTQASLTTQPTLSTTAVTGSTVGTYPINATGAVSSNYTITYTASTLTVTQAPLTITAANQTKVLNTANPTLAATYTGFVNGDTNASLTTQPSLITTAVLASPVGTYPITASGAVSANYSIGYVPGTLTVTASPNANLANLVISSGTLSPVFAQGTTTYTASVGNGVTSVTITPTTADPTSSVKVNGVTVTSGNASGSISLAVGANTITTIVTAQNGTTTVTYTVVVTRAPSSNANLASLTLNSGTLTPVFAPATYTYTALVDNTVSQIVLTPTLADATASILLNGQSAANTQGATLNLLVGDNAISVFTTAQDGVTKLTYTLTIHRATAPEFIKPNNILSPNGDGKNDTWIVKDIQSYPNNTVKVYDRAGRIIYSKHTYANDWNGTYQGNTLAEGTYYYVIDLGTGDDAIKGFVTIVRSR